MEWEKSVLSRDNNCCCRCNKDTSNVVRIFSERKETFEVSNGITICEECAKEYQDKYGQESNWCTWEKFVNEKGKTLRRPIISIR